MGLVYTDLRLSNPALPALDEMDANALVDTGSVHLCIPRHVAIQLKLNIMEQREIQTADGSLHLIDYAGPVLVSMFGRSSFTGALVLGDQVLLGAIPLEDMDLVVDPRRQRVTVNPKSPNIASSIVKRAA